MKARTLTGPTELLTFFEFPKPQWKTLRTTNTIERLHGEFRRRVKTQGSFRRSRKQMIASLTFPPVAGRNLRNSGERFSDLVAKPGAPNATALGGHKRVYVLADLPPSEGGIQRW